MTTVTQTLRAEHEEILKMLTVAEALAHRLDKEERVPQKTLEKVVEFFGVFVGKCHDGKENDILFPALISKGLPRKDSLVGSLLRQHKQGWPLFRALADATYDAQFHFDGSGQRWAHAARIYCEFMRHHIAQEDNTLLPEAEGILGPHDQADLRTKFDRFEAETIGLSTHQQMHRMVEEMAGKSAA